MEAVAGAGLVTSSLSTSSRSSCKLGTHGTHSQCLKQTMLVRRICASVQEISKVNGSKVHVAKVEESRIGATTSQETNVALPTTVRPINGGAITKCPAFDAVISAIASVALKRPIEQMVGKTEMDVDFYRQGRLVEGRLVYRQTFVIRSYEVGADKTASIETFMNQFQETALNHVWMSGLLGDGFGTTHAMIRNNLIWVVTCMQVQVEGYPAWGTVVEIDTWVQGSGKNGMRRDWLVRDYNTGQILGRATSTWVMMNKKTRRLSKMPEDVRAEISPHYLERSAVTEEKTATHEKIKKLDDTAQFVRSGLTPRRSDLDMNQHVNNVKYIGWMFESVPTEILEGHELTNMTLEYRRECGQCDVVQSMSSCTNSTSDQEEGAATYTDSNASVAPPQCTHLLRLQVDGAEIVRGKTQWRLRASGNLPPDQK